MRLRLGRVAFGKYMMEAPPGGLTFRCSTERSLVWELRSKDPPSSLKRRLQRSSPEPSQRQSIAAATSLCNAKRPEPDAVEVEQLNSVSGALEPASFYCRRAGA